MVEIAIFIGIILLVTRTKTWTQGPYVSDHVQFKAIITSCLDEGPLRFTAAKQGTEDPNSNPDYIWNEGD